MDQASVDQADAVRHEPGHVHGVLGENGAGKTTLVKLLCRLYAPTQGRILVDGVDLARIRPESWRGAGDRSDSGLRRRGRSTGAERAAHHDRIEGGETRPAL